MRSNSKKIGVGDTNIAAHKGGVCHLMSRHLDSADKTQKEQYIHH